MTESKISTFFILISAIFAFIAALFFVFENYQKKESSKIRKAIENYWIRLELDNLHQTIKYAILLFLKIRKYNIVLAKLKKPLKITFIILAFSYIIFGILFFVMVDTVLTDFMYFIGNIVNALLNVLLALLIISLLKYLTKRTNKVFTILLVFASISIVPGYLMWAIRDFLRFTILSYSGWIDLLFSPEIFASIEYRQFYVVSILFIILNLFAGLFVITFLIKTYLDFVYFVLTKVSLLNSKYLFFKKVKSLLIFSIFISLCLSIVALIIGNDVKVSDYFPFSFQLLISNFVCDFGTVIITFLILKRALKSIRSYEIFLLILLDIFFAAIFAIFSLYFGLINTSHSKSLLECIQLLIGSNVQSEHNYIYFYLMHTTFIPTVSYLFVIVTMLISKFVVSKSRYFLIPDNTMRPYALFRSLFLLLGAIFAILIAILNL